MLDREMNAAPQTGVGVGHEVRYALLTPVRDEQAYIGDMIESIAAQTVPPAHWIIVDDGSRDKTAAIVSEYARRLDFLTLLQLAPRDRRLAGGEGAVPHALKHLRLNDFDYLARFDSDLVLPDNYFECILAKFRANPKLGIAGGTLYVEKAGRLVAEKEPSHHVRGALKMYRRECFEEIGDLTTQIGWDTLDEVSAWAHGWSTRSFEDIGAIHRRPTGASLPASEIYLQRGNAEYLTWSDPVFVLGKAFRIAVAELSVVKPVCYLLGFVGGYLRRTARIHSPEIVRCRRRQQRQRILHMFGVPAKSRE